MDPLSATAAVLYRAGKCIEGLDLIMRYATETKLAELKAIELHVESCAIQLSLRIIHDELESSPQGEEKEVRDVIKSCDFIFGLLYRRLQPILSVGEVGGSNNAGLRARISGLRYGNEATLLLSLMRGQARTLSFVLDALKCKSLLERRRLLRSQEMQEWLNQISSDTASLRSASRLNTESEIVDHSIMEMGDEEEEEEPTWLDERLMSSTLYRRMDLAGQARESGNRGKANVTTLYQTQEPAEPDPGVAKRRKRILERFEWLSKIGLNRDKAAVSQNSRIIKALQPRWEWPKEQEEVPFLTGEDVRRVRDSLREAATLLCEVRGDIVSVGESDGQTPTEKAARADEMLKDIYSTVLAWRGLSINPQEEAGVATEMLQLGGGSDGQERAPFSTDYWREGIIASLEQLLFRSN